MNLAANVMIGIRRKSKTGDHVQRYLKINLLTILFIVLSSGHTYLPSPLQWKEAGAVFQPTEFVPNQVLVKFDYDLPDETTKRIIRRADAKVLSIIDSIGVTILEVPNSDLDTVIGDWRQQAGVVYVEPNYYVSATETTPNDPGWGNQ